MNEATGQKMKRSPTVDSEEKEKLDDDGSTLVKDMQQLASYPENALQTFPFRLFGLLCDKQFENAIRWSSDGKSFGVMPLEFTNRVLNIYFRGSQFESFIRKLSRWQFTRKATDSEFPIYAVVHSHPLFQRGHPELIPKMTCVSKNKKRKTSHAEEAKESIMPAVLPTGLLEHSTSSLTNQHEPRADQIREALFARNIGLVEILREGMRSSLTNPHLLIDHRNLLSLASQSSQALTPLQSFLVLEQERLAIARNRSVLASQSNPFDHLLRRNTDNTDLLLSQVQSSRLFPQVHGLEPRGAVGGLSTFPLLLNQREGPIARFLNQRVRSNSTRANSLLPHNTGDPSPSRGDSSSDNVDLRN